MFKSLLPWKHTKTKVMVSEQTMEDETIRQHLVPCDTCGRTFLPLPLKKHAPICEKTLVRKRRVFDSLKQRVDGTDLAHFHQKTYLKRQDSTPKTAEKVKNPSQWEENHQKLVAAIRTAKGTSRDMSPCKKPQAVGSTHERCPCCDRQFGPKAFDRHVEWCKEHRIRIQKSPANVLLAKERLEARTKYKVPPLTKSKRSLVKEKYSNGSVINRTESICSVKSVPGNPPRRNPTIHKPRSVLDLGKKIETPGKGDHKGAVEEAKKHKEAVKSVDTTTPYDPFASAERQFMELLRCDSDFKLSTDEKPRVRVQRPLTAAPKNAAKSAKKSVKSAAPTNKKRASVIDPPVCFQDLDDDFELLENLLNDRLSDGFFLGPSDKNGKYSDEVSSIDSNLINETDNLSIPEHFKLDSCSPTDTDATIRNSNVDLYSLQCDKKIEPLTRKTVKGRARKTKTKSDCRDAAKVVDSKGKNAASPKKNKEETAVDANVKLEELFTVDDEMYAEYKIYEEMYLKEKEQAAHTKKQRGKNAINSYGIEIDPQTNKISDDSAYGSLNRTTPQPKTLNLSPTQRRRKDSASSSGSENVRNSPVAANQRISKFCHECGNKYPLTTAKFCVECGVRRLVL